jgi:hypothetical protein
MRALSVAALSNTGTLAFRVAYDAYGEARHLPAKDVNGDGKVDKTDTTLAQAASGKKLGQPGKATAVGTPRPKCRAARGPQEAEASAYP